MERIEMVCREHHVSIQVLKSGCLTYEKEPVKEKVFSI